jgi:hypothetical protein
VSAAELFEALPRGRVPDDRVAAKRRSRSRCRPNEAAARLVGPFSSGF